MAVTGRGSRHSQQQPVWRWRCSSLVRKPQYCSKGWGGGAGNDTHVCVAIWFVCAGGYESDISMAVLRAVQRCNPASRVQVLQNVTVAGQLADTPGMDGCTVNSMHELGCEPNQSRTGVPCTRAALAPLARSALSMHWHASVPAPASLPAQGSAAPAASTAGHRDGCSTACHYCNTLSRVGGALARRLPGCCSHDGHRRARHWQWGCRRRQQHSLHPCQQLPLAFLHSCCL